MSHASFLIHYVSSVTVQRDYFTNHKCHVLKLEVLDSDGNVVTVTLFSAADNRIEIEEEAELAAS